MRKIVTFFLAVMFSASSHAYCVIGDPTSNCAGQAINQALQNSQQRNQAMWDIINSGNAASQQARQNQQYWINRSHQQTQQNQQMLQNMLQQMDQQSHWQEQAQIKRQQLQEQRRHNAYTEMQQDSTRAFMMQQAQEEWERRRKPCTAYHHEGYLGGPEQPDSITVYDRNCN